MMKNQPTIPIDYKQLKANTLENLLTEVVLREGTDYGEMEISLEDKKTQLHKKLVQGDVMILFNVDENLCDIVSTDDFK